MNGNEILIDTNIVLYLLKGDDTLVEILQSKQAYVSFMTELELLGFKDMPEKEEQQIRFFLNDNLIISMNNSIKEKYIDAEKEISAKVGRCRHCRYCYSLQHPLNHCRQTVQNSKRTRAPSV